jgi:malonate-semialdehyde dehydrogenase (acetylating)/methylmalonate-semialdehyde dehydrogenase
MGSGPVRELRSPYTGTVISRVASAAPSDVARIVAESAAAGSAWRELPLRERAQLLLGLRGSLLQRADELATLIALESGKTPAEAKAGLVRGIEVLEFAIGLPNMDVGSALDVSRGVRCETRREPLGVVVGITPFNFPAMVPLWMLPLALCVGNTFILKPSEKTPQTACALGQALCDVGFPPGVFSIAHGGADTVQALLDETAIEAVAFVGSTTVAASVYGQAAARGKRALCLGGAKNHLIVMPDADPALTVQAVFDSFTGCAGQRCMAGSVLVCVGDAERIVESIAELCRRCQPGVDMGALIDPAARHRLVTAIERAQGEGARVRVDGRAVLPPAKYAGGNWLGPTLLDRVEPQMQCATDELFGPVLSVIRVESLDAALALEQRSPYGNATSVFTSSGAVARYVADRASSGMVGVNVGVPVPRDPFSFGGTKRSRFGHGDMTGHGGVEFWTQLKKITSKWALQRDSSWIS